MKRTWFLTGTDTNIGKTIVSSVMLIKAKKHGFYTAGYKPISTGCIKTKKGLRNLDALLLKKYSIIKFPYNTINPFAFYDSEPPHILSQKNKINITFKKISNELYNIQKKANWIIIEGVGGWYTPISPILKFSDWVKKENIPIILVIGLKLGCINHAILTNQAILKSGLIFSGWIANCISNKNKYVLDYINTLKKYIYAPFLGKVPYIKNIKNLSKISANIHLPK
ncbi:dethiobiotin synthase [Buchnera aphidicola]|uniref:dethiobiotin synthase n=1 Tax=Buchnera aphidicola TaxID=9 RepID=UPI003463BFAF